MKPYNSSLFLIRFLMTPQFSETSTPRCLFPWDKSQCLPLSGINWCCSFELFILDRIVCGSWVNIASPKFICLGREHHLFRTVSVWADGGPYSAKRGGVFIWNGACGTQGGLKSPEDHVFHSVYWLRDAGLAGGLRSWREAGDSGGVLPQRPALWLYPAFQLTQRQASGVPGLCVWFHGII